MRYVILHHTGAPEGDHYDLMLERDGVLATWRLASPNPSSPAARIRDHRIDYLTIEGPIGRGRVNRVASGTYDVVAWTETEVRVRIAGAEVTLPANPVPN